MTGDWYGIKNTDAIDTPAFVVYPERAKENIRLLKSMINDVDRLRPHVKTHKTKEVVLMMMEAGINKFKCATIAEAEMLGMCHAADVLLAYPLSRSKLSRLVALVKKYPHTHFSCIADSLRAVQLMSAMATDSGIVLPVYIDLNNGMNRTGIRPGNEAVQLYGESVLLPGIEVKGLHVYDGHIRNKDWEERVRACHDAFRPVLKMKETLQQKGYRTIKIIAGGSPTFPVFARLGDIECSPGTFIYWDKGYQDTIPEQAFLPAALVITRVVSCPGERLLCLDMGYKAIASENELKNRVHFLNAPGITIVSQSEEHLVVDAGENHHWKTGDILYGLPIHVCPTCAVYETAFTIENGLVTGSWKIVARDRAITV